MAEDFHKPHSCNHCQRLQLNAPIPEQHKYKFEFSLTDVVQAAAEHCLLCQWFLDEINKSEQWQQVAENSAAHDSLKLYIYQYGFKTGSNPVISWFGLAGPQTQLNCTTLNGFRICTPSDNVASCDISTRPIYRDVGSDYHFGTVRNWLEECITNHEDCPKPTNSFMPTRVIEIIKNDTDWHLRLHQSSPTEVEPYVALSYCWGGDQLIKATKLTSPDWGVSLHFEILPKTLQDAIVVTSKLNIRYLWVDALCITQDDAEDMAREISQMAQIYSSSMVTIAASRARSVNEGFLQVRNAGDPPHLTFELPYKTEKGELGSVTLLCPKNFQDLMNRSEPLDARAWAFQERLLSPRLLDYGSRQSRWICRVLHSHENAQYVDGWESCHQYQFPLNSRDWLFDRLRQHKRHLNDCLNEWSDIVESYSACSLTFASDKLPALSAAAEKLGSLLSDSYVAGMWNSALRFNLCWYRKNATQPPSNARPREYRAPSWSWASINDQVIMYFPGNYRAENSRFILQILDCHVVLADVMVPYGAVTSGLLTVKGRIKQIERRDNGSSTEMRWNSMGIKEGLDVTPLTIRLDALEDGLVYNGDEQTPIFALEIFKYCLHISHFIDMGYEGLLICKSQARNGDAVYRRVGYFQTEERPIFQRQSEEDEESWRERNFECLKLFDDCEPQVITII